MNIVNLAVCIGALNSICDGERGFILVQPFQRNWPVNLPSVFALEAVDTIR